MKEQVITEEMIVSFLNKEFYKSAPVYEKWKQFKNDYQSPKNEWEVVEYEYGTCHYTNLMEDTSKIKQVRRKSDGATLEVGKEYKIETIKRSKFLSKIKSFFNDPVDGLGVIFENGFTIYLIIITSIVESKEVQWVVFTSDSFGYLPYEAQQFNGIKQSGEKIKVFLTEKEAEEFIRWNNPNKSLAMIREALEAGNNSGVFISDAMLRIRDGFNRLKNNSNGE